MQIGTRLSISYSILLTLLISISLVSIIRLESITASNQEIINGDAIRADLANKINLHAESAAGRLTLLFILDDRELRVKTYQEIDTHNAAIDHALERLVPLLTHKNDTKLLNQLTHLRAEYEREFSITVEEIESGNRAGAIQRMAGRTRDSLNALLAETSHLALSQYQSMIARQTASADAALSAKQLVILISIAATSLGLVMAFFMTKSITSPMNSAVAAVSRIANGDLETKIVTITKDEIGYLLLDMENMRQRLREVIKSIHHGADAVSLAEKNLQIPALQVTTGSTEQQELAHRIQSSISHLASGVTSMAEQVENVRKTALFAVDMAKQGADDIVIAADEIAKTTETVSASAKSVGTLDENAKSVANTVSVIKEIADQTNLLALNASIEAARAGESGRGFSVVADEVRKLANRTATATHEIDRVIIIITEQIAQAAYDIETGRVSMERGNQLIRSIVSPLNELRISAQHSLDGLEVLNHVAQQQAVESKMIAEHIVDIVTKANVNTLAAYDVNRITQDLGQMAENLQTSIKTFRI